MHIFATLLHNTEKKASVMANVQSLVDMMTDSEFLFGVHKKIGFLVNQNITVYQYVLTHRGQFSITQLNGVPETVLLNFNSLC